MEKIEELTTKQKEYYSGGMFLIGGYSSYPGQSLLLTIYKSISGAYQAGYDAASQVCK